MENVGRFPDSNGEQEAQDFGQLLDSFYDFDEPQRGDIREAEILQIHPNEIVVDVGVKRDGIVPSQDLERLNPAMLKELSVGDVIPVYIMNPMDSDGNLVVSINLGLQGHDWDHAVELLDSGDVVEVTIVGFNKGGALVKFGRLEGFVPVSHLVDIPTGLSGPQRQEAMEQVIGQTIGVKVIEVNQRRRRLILSQREAQRENRTNQKERLLEELAVGDIVPGRVTGIRDFGVFVDIGGADGLIHVSELAWHRVPHPSDLVSIGDELEVYVLDLDHEQQRIALSLARTKPDPWLNVEENHYVDEIVEGTVGNVVDFGAFIVLDDGIEGLLHVTEMGDGTLQEPHSYVKRGDRVAMRIVRIEPERKRIGFTQKDLAISQPTEEVKMLGEPFADDLHEEPAAEEVEMLGEPFAGDPLEEPAAEDAYDETSDE